MRRATFLTLSSDVLSRVALQTVYQSCTPPAFTFHLQTLSSLLVTCRDIYDNLSPSANPYIYGKIFSLLFDVESIQRRLGTSAVRSTTLTHELRRRLSMLKRLKTFLNIPNHDLSPLPETMVSDLILLLFMLTENDGKNSQRLREIFGRLGVADLCTALLASCSSAHSALWEERTKMVVRFLTTMVMCIDPEEACEYESAEKTEAILDILEPLAIQSDADGNISIVNCIYFNLRGVLILSSLAYTRLCIVKRYDAIKRRRSNSLFASSPVALTSGDIDADFFQLVRFSIVHPDSNQLSSHPTVLTIPRSSVPILAQNVQTAFETVWTGGWFVPIAEGSSVFTVYSPMKFRIRAYISRNNEAVQFVENGGECLTNAWFNEGVQLSEIFNLLNIFDPITGKTSFYEPGSSDHETVMTDTILFGETISVDGNDALGDFIIHGRIRSDGKLALIRTPTNDMNDLGVWIFHGSLNCGHNFVGDWWNTSTAKDAPGGRGWFRFVKDMSLVA